MDGQRVFLVWEWTEEREGKIHHAICSSAAKGKDAAQRLWDEQSVSRGDPTSMLVWKQEGDDRISWTGYQQNTHGDDYPYEVSAFELNVLEVDEWRSGRLLTRRILV